MSALSDLLAALRAELADVQDDTNVDFNRVAALQNAISEVEATIAEMASTQAQIAALQISGSGAAEFSALQKQLAALKAAYRSGLRSVQYENKQISYVSAEEMRAAIASLEAELGISRTGAIVIRSVKGW